MAHRPGSVNLNLGQGGFAWLEHTFVKELGDPMTRTIQVASLFAATIACAGALSGCGGDGKSEGDGNAAPAVSTTNEVLSDEASNAAPTEVPETGPSSSDADPASSANPTLSAEDADFINRAREAGALGEDEVISSAAALVCQYKQTGAPADQSEAFVMAMISGGSSDAAAAQAATTTFIELATAQYCP